MDFLTIVAKLGAVLPTLLVGLPAAGMLQSTLVPPISWLKNVVFPPLLLVFADDVVDLVPFSLGLGEPFWDWQGASIPREVLSNFFVD